MPVENESASVSPQKWLAFFVVNFLTLRIYPMDFKLHRGGKGASPREHR
ncbi:tRNA glutamyl-Q synthetase [Xenorhabdus stockiae]|uniref:tRNA glutamyl-Q synthetase n=1 Tax=Xenorhabdus stockiae TaxID=351614 RepID=A0A2D0KLM2_9GAMM|nr:tRNA glutamyl-Q synthetase [Xenorhabdus stockiae]PHM68365.1 tRNA glutamyl-Q synthetase [Xenorhabdus sp. KJ12.1]